MELIDVAHGAQMAIEGNADGASFFGNDDDDGVGLFREADGGLVAHAVGGAEVLLLAEGEDAASGVGAVFADDNAAIVEGRAAVEDGFDEGVVRKQRRVDDLAGFGVAVEADFLFDGDEGAGAVLG